MWFFGNDLCCLWFLASLIHLWLSAPHIYSHRDIFPLVGKTCCHCQSGCPILADKIMPSPKMSLSTTPEPRSMSPYKEKHLADMIKDLVIGKSSDIIWMGQWNYRRPYKKEAGWEKEIWLWKMLGRYALSKKIGSMSKECRWSLEAREVNETNSSLDSRSAAALTPWFQPCEIYLGLLTSRTLR